MEVPIKHCFVGDPGRSPSLPSLKSGDAAHVNLLLVRAVSTLLGTLRSTTSQARRRDLLNKSILHEPRGILNILHVFRTRLHDASSRLQDDENSLRCESCSLTLTSAQSLQSF